MASTINLADLTGQNEKKIVNGTQPIIRADGKWLTHLAMTPVTRVTTPFICLIDGKHDSWVDVNCKELSFSPDSTMILVDLAPAKTAPGPPDPFGATPPAAKYSIDVILLPQTATDKKQVFKLAAADSGKVDPHPVFSPDSSQILYIKDDGLYVMTKKTVDGKLSFTSALVFPGTKINRAKYSQDGQKIVFLKNGDLYSINVDGSGQTKRLTTLRTVQDYAFYPTNGLLLFTASPERGVNGMIPGGPGMPPGGGPTMNPGPMGAPVAMPF